jgi:ribosomal protein RSM22 (predicted rRNA methylase)
MPGKIPTGATSRSGRPVRVITAKSKGRRSRSRTRSFPTWRWRARRPTGSARVLAHPRVGKAEVGAKLCTSDGIVATTASRRDASTYKTRKGWRWGDAVDWPLDPT